jgi:chitin disaccharide deacetylase
VIVLNADDYALTPGVSHAIDALADAGRLSATSVLATSPHWPALAPALASRRGRLAVGLHVDLTLGIPLGPMPRLAPAGRFPGLPALLRGALLGALDAGELRAEILRQLECFERALGHPPDHVDGHEHVHVLPGVRGALLDAVGARAGLLVRDPTAATTPPGLGIKPRIVQALALGFGARARRRGHVVNDAFAGFSRFDTRRPYADELRAALDGPGTLRVVMCHPGFPDAALAALDPVTTRRRQEYEALAAEPGLEARIWRPERGAEGARVDWGAAIAG